MVLTEKENEVLGYLRNPLFRNILTMQGNHSPVEDMSDEEIVSLYNKMDRIIEDASNDRRVLRRLDEMYILELQCVKEKLFKECQKRRLK